MHRFMDMPLPAMQDADGDGQAADATIEDVDVAAIEGAVRTILQAVGEDPDRPGLLDTPRRVAKMYREMFAGLRHDPCDIFRLCFLNRTTNWYLFEISPSIACANTTCCRSPALRMSLTFRTDTSRA